GIRGPSGRARLHGADLRFPRHRVVAAFARRARAAHARLGHEGHADGDRLAAQAPARPEADPCMPFLRRPGARPVAPCRRTRRPAIDWARFCRSPHYLIDDAGRPLRPHNDRIRARMRMISFSDDNTFGPRRGVDVLATYYPNARIERLHVAPADWGLKQIGHF